MIRLYKFYTIAINAVYNRHYGPGGSTRRLHLFGGDAASTYVIKRYVLLGQIPPQEFNKITFNKSNVFVAAANDNSRTSMKLRMTAAAA